MEAVTIATIVRESSGKHISGLKASDFTVYEQGKVQRVASVDEYVTSPTLPHAPEAKDVFSNVVVSEGERSRLTIILLDLLNSNFGDQAQARRQIAKFLAQWDSHEPVALVAFSCRGLEVAHSFTRDPKLLIAALNRIAGTQAYDVPSDIPPGPRVATGAQTETEKLATAVFNQAMEHAFEGGVCGTSQHTVEITNNAIRQLGRALSGLPGRKSVIWLTAGMALAANPNMFKLLPRLSRSDFSVDSSRDLGSALERARAYKELADANTAVYPVDVKGLIAYVPLPDVPTPRNPASPVDRVDLRAELDDDRISDLRDAAELTGGKAFYRSNDLAAGLRKAVEDSIAYYMLTYYRNTNDDRPGWRDLKVKVNRPGVDVRARKGFVVLGPIPPARTRSADLSLLTYAALDLTGVPIEARLKPVVVSKGERRVEYSLHVPGTALTVDTADGNHVVADWLMIVMKDGKMTANRGQTIDKHASQEELSELLAKGLNHDSSVTLPEDGEYSLRFAIRDGISGRIGSVTVPIESDTHAQAEAVPIRDTVR